MTGPRNILFSAVKNEAPFLLEWVAYYRAIGFDRIVVVSNDSDDGTTELLDALDAAGILHHIHHSVAPGESPQGKAASVANASGLIGDGDWVIWLDADEFLNIHTGQGRVQDLTEAMGTAQAMLIPWRIFGDGGNAVFPGRFISSAFSRAAGPDHEGNRIIKTLFRHRDEATRLSAIANHRPHLLRRHAIAPDEVLNAAGRPIDMTFPVNRRWIAGVEGKANFRIPETDFDWSLAQINHYMLRTREMFDLKAHRGRGFVNVVKGKAVDRPRHSPAFFATNNRNEAEDKTILRHHAATTRELTRLMDNKAIRAAQEAGLRLTAERLAALQQADSNALAETSSDPIHAAEPAAPEVPAADGLFVPEFTMPEAERDYVARHYAAHDVILEYGSGGSTLMAAAQQHSLVMSVESDRAWCDNLQRVVDRDFPKANLRLHWADIGPTGKWGRPVNHRAWEKFAHYPLGVWDMPWFRHPDLILIDGRFRVGCLLAALFRCERPITVLFDDYTPRPHYIQAVESFLRPVEVVGRLARFELAPTPYPVARMAEITALLSRLD